MGTKPELRARGTLGPSSAPDLAGPWVLEMVENGKSLARMSGFGSPEQKSDAQRIAILWNEYRNVSMQDLPDVLSGIVDLFEDMAAWTDIDGMCQFCSKETAQGEHHPDCRGVRAQEIIAKLKGEDHGE
ncbi:hypothetical protein [Pseudodesulfovibrio pelocollis]|uniref:hypothetical protein n=1 Tax=Pseudodesulfovibrio pelocollis TaxID=3051432 RepID=UPI00255AA28C|nr:hypothetical protein [Pseudodesulfovibrio sp. SB368]